MLSAQQWQIEHHGRNPLTSYQKRGRNSISAIQGSSNHTNALIRDSEIRMRGVKQRRNLLEVEECNDLPVL